MRTVIIIPARYKSSRFPGKPLVRLLGKPMILWVAELSAKALKKSDVYIATDDLQIKGIVEEAGFQVIMTSENCLTGTDRVAEAANKIDADFYVNIQGDEPLLNPDDIKKLIQAKIENPNFVINGYKALTENEDPSNTNLPKVVFNSKKRLVYMSRHPVPGNKKGAKSPDEFYKQVCVYVFNLEELQAFSKFDEKSDIEFYEDIEILRFFETNHEILCVETSGSSIAVDTPEDVKRAEESLTKSIS